MRPLTAYMELQLLGAVSAQGRVAEARARLGELVQKSRDAGWAADALGSAVAWGAGLAPGPETRAAAEEAVRLRPDYAWTSVYLAQMGDLQAAARIGRSIAPESTLRAKLDAVVAWKQGDLERARTLLAAAEARDPYGQDYGCIPAFLQAEVAAAAGDAPATLDAVRRYLSFWPRGIWRSWAYPRSLFLRAQALSRLGRRDEARLALDRLLALWENADPGLPILAESRQLRASLH
jgi:tetratricopeptide (TPR) repeat protein